MTPAPPPFTCEVVRVYDGDGPLWCRSGEKVRVAGIQSPDLTSAEPCRQHRPGYVCDDRRSGAAQRIAERLTLGKRLNCQPVGRSYRRVVARCRLPDGRSLSCALIAAGAADLWRAYWRRYKMGRCS